MPYAFDYTPTYKSLIRAYWVAQINGSAFSNKSAMIAELDVFLDAITTAESTYKTNNNDLSQYFLRTRWQQYFGILNLYVLYQHCMSFPASENIPAIQGMILPWPSGDLITGEDLRGFSVAWRYSWPGDGMTSTPWFTLADLGGGTGQVQEIDNGLGVGEATAMKNAFDNNYPTYSARYANSGSYDIGIDSGGGSFGAVTDANPACADRDRFKYFNEHRPNYGTIDRMNEFINVFNWTTQNMKRFRDGRAILNYLAAGGSIIITQKPIDWMLSHGGQELMDYFGWTSINGNIL